MSTWRTALAVAIVALTLAGCLRVETSVTLGTDDTASGSFVVAVKKGSGDAYGMTDRELAEAIWEEYPRAASLGDTHTSTYDADGFRGVKVTFSDAPLAAFAPTAEMWGITRDGDTYVVSGPSNATGQAATTADTGQFTGDIGELDDAQFTLAITFPGKVADANGSVSGRTVSWDLQHGPDTLSAHGAATASADPAVGVAYVVFGALVIGGLAYGLAGRLRRPQR